MKTNSGLHADRPRRRIFYILEKQHFYRCALISDQTFAANRWSQSVFSSPLAALVFFTRRPRALSPSHALLLRTFCLLRDYRLAFQNLNTMSMKASSSALSLSAEPGGPRWAGAQMHSRGNTPNGINTQTTRPCNIHRRFTAALQPQKKKICVPVAIVKYAGLLRTLQPESVFTAAK